jgi:hypothetical protein
MAKPVVKWSRSEVCFRAKLQCLVVAQGARRFPQHEIELSRMRHPKKGICHGSAESNAHQTWNVGRIIGPKPPLKPKHIWAIAHGFSMKGEFAISLCSILRSIASFGDATSFASVWAMSSLEAPFDSERLLFNRRLGGPYHSN